MLTENFQLSEDLHYKILKLAVKSPNKRKPNSAIVKSINKNYMNIFLKITRTMILSSAILYIYVLQTNNAYSFAKIISLTASCGSYSDETVVRLEDQATDSFDGNWDAYKFPNTDNTPNFYTEIVGTTYSINSFSGDFQNYSLNLDLKVAFSGNYIITTKSLLNSSEGCTYTIVLEDKLLDSFIVLEENKQYAFHASDSDYAGRFVLHYKNEASAKAPDLTAPATTLPGNNNVDFSVSELGFNIDFINPSSATAAIQIFNINGKEIFLSDNVSTQSTVRIPVNGNNSKVIYIVKVVVDTTVCNKKIYY
jgi:hypothetical protein